MGSSSSLLGNRNYFIKVNGKFKFEVVNDYDILINVKDILHIIDKNGIRNIVLKSEKLPIVTHMNLGYFEELLIVSE